MSVDSNLPNPTQSTFYTHLTTLCTNLKTVYSIPPKNFALEIFEDLEADIKNDENRESHEVEDLKTLETLLINVFKECDPSLFETSKCSATDISIINKDKSITRSATLIFIENRILELGSVIKENQQEKAEESKEDSGSKPEKKEYPEITDFIKQTRDDEQNKKFQHLISWTKIYLYL